MSADCVFLIVELTFFRAFSRPVVSPPISTVIPLIRPARATASFRQRYKCPDCSGHENGVSRLTDAVMTFYQLSYNHFFLLKRIRQETIIAMLKTKTAR